MSKMREFPQRLTPKWLLRNVESFTADEWVEARRQMRDKGWNRSDNNRHVEWFLWGCLPRETKRELDRRGLA